MTEELRISDPRTNDRIRVPEVRLVGPNGEQVGVVRIEDAIRLAQEADLDLVEVAPNSKPPVAKIMDFGKFKYETAQKVKEAKRNQSNTILKEVRFRLKIDVHDYETKRKRAEGFLKTGDKVKAMILFRGREQSRPDQGVRLLQRFAEDVSEFGTVESTPMIDGRNMVMVIGPLKTKAEVKAEVDAKKPVAKPRVERSADDMDGDSAERVTVKKVPVPKEQPVAVFAKAPPAIRTAPVTRSAPVTRTAAPTSATAASSASAATAATAPADAVAKAPVRAAAPKADAPKAEAPKADAPKTESPVVVSAPAAVSTPAAASAPVAKAAPAKAAPAVVPPKATEASSGATATPATPRAAAPKPGTPGPRPTPGSMPKPRAVVPTPAKDVTSD